MPVEIFNILFHFGFTIKDKKIINDGMVRLTVARNNFNGVFNKFLPFNKYATFSGTYNSK